MVKLKINDATIYHIFGYIREMNQLADDFINPMDVFQNPRFVERWGTFSQGALIKSCLIPFIKQSHFFSKSNTKGRGIVCQFIAKDPDLAPVVDRYISFIKSVNSAKKVKKSCQKPKKYKEGDRGYLPFEVLAIRRDTGALFVRIADQELWIKL